MVDRTRGESADGDQTAAEAGSGSATEDHESTEAAPALVFDVSHSSSRFLEIGKLRACRDYNPWLSPLCSF